MFMTTQMQVSKCLFPVAGSVRVFFRLRRKAPRNASSIDKPIIHYGVEEAVRSGCKDIVFVTGRGKRAIEDYFDRSWELEQLLEARDKFDLRDMVRDISHMARFSYVRQCEPLGLGHAVLCGEQVCEGEPFGVILPDDVMLGTPPVSGSSFPYTVHSVVPSLPSGGHPEDTSRYGIVDADPVGEGVYRIRNMVEKPPSLQRRVACNHGALCPFARDFRELQRPEPWGGRVPTHRRDRALLDKDSVWGFVNRGKRLDCGTKAGWLRATTSWPWKIRDKADRSVGA